MSEWMGVVGVFIFVFVFVASFTLLILDMVRGC